MYWNQKNCVIAYYYLYIYLDLCIQLLACKKQTEEDVYKRQDNGFDQSDCADRDQVFGIFFGILIFFDYMCDKS